MKHTFDDVAFGLTFHHLGMAVRNPEKGKAMLSLLGYRFGESVYDPYQKVHLVYGQHAAMPAMELVFPSSEPGPLDRILAANGEGPYHVCLAATDGRKSVEKLKAAGQRLLCISDWQPAILFGGCEVAFYSVPGLGLIEILDLGERL